MKVPVQLGLLGPAGVIVPQLVTVELSLELGRVPVEKKVIVLDQQQMGSNAEWPHVTLKCFSGTVTWGILEIGEE